MAAMIRQFALMVAPAGLFMALFFVIPCGVLFAYSFGHTSYVDITFGTSPDSYLRVVSTPLFREVILRSLLTGGCVGLASVVLAFPLAYAITLGPLRRAGTLILLLVIVSLFTAYIVRIYAWRALLGRNGVISQMLTGVGLTNAPLEAFSFSKAAVIVTLTSILVPVAVLPLTAALSGVSPQCIEAARSLGATAFGALVRITIPLASRGIISAFALTFVVAAGDFVTPQLLGGPQAQLAGNAIVGRFGLSFDWPLGSAIAFTLVVAMGLSLWVLTALLRRLGLRDRI
jgi:spermidine/putrescine transport system permease protein